MFTLFPPGLYGDARHENCNLIASLRRSTLSLAQPAAIGVTYLAARLGLMEYARRGARVIVVDRHELPLGSPAAAAGRPRSHRSAIAGSASTFSTSITTNAVLDAGVANEQRYTIGTRLFGTSGPIDCNLEFVYQFGRFGNRPVGALSGCSSI